jgi:hypothetical protein
MKVPCEECLCYVMCKRRLSNHYDTGSISEMACKEKCKLLQEFVNMSDQDSINKARILFDLEPYK